MNKNIKDLNELEGLAMELASFLRPPIGVLLKGDLGVGKTTLVRAVLRALGWTDPVPSPTYPILIPYEIDGLKIAHIDAFRLEPSSLPPWSWPELSDHLLFIEWPERLRLPPNRSHYEITMVMNSDGSRNISVHELKPS